MNSDINIRIADIEKEIRETPYHKGTEHHIGKLRARIAKLKSDLYEKESKQKGGGGGGYAIKKSGDATIVLVGPPSVGKSSLLNLLTSAKSKVADYAFTTTTVIPGAMDLNGAKLQIFDIPGLITGASKGKGRGRQVISVVRNADLLLIMVDVDTIHLLDNIKKELHLAGIRLNQDKPKIIFKKDIQGGIRIVSSIEQTNVSQNLIRSVAEEFRFKNGDIILKENITLERLIDAFAKTCLYTVYLVVVNKVDKNKVIKHPYGEALEISVKDKININKLKDLIWGKLDLIRVYLKKKDSPPDYINPFIIKKGKSLKDLLNIISICNKSDFKKAKIWGPGAKFPGQLVNFNFIPQDQTIVFFI